MSRTKLLQLRLTLCFALIWALAANAQQPLNYEPPPGGDAPPPQTATGSTDR